MNYVENIYTFIQRCVQIPGTYSEDCIDTLTLLDDEEEIVDLISTCQNEINEECYQHKDDEHNKLKCKPLEEIVNTKDKMEDFYRNIIDIFNPIDSLKKFISQGSFSTTYSIDSNIVLRLTQQISCEKIMI